MLVALYFLSALLEVGALFLILFFLLRQAGPFIIHFDPYVGINATGTIQAVFQLYFVNVFIVILNFCLAWLLSSRAPLFAHLLAVTAFLVAVLIFIYIGVIISVN